MMNVDRRRPPGMRPVRPGAVLRDDLRPALGLSVTDMARRPGRLCGNGSGVWLRMQADLDLWQAERARIEPAADERAA
ncbi:hypothetical protein [Achromobacter sp.]|uniref:helix-turn-helix transcriptional regulator n=1 Tax=Achromobacter sp. TaxID=134375 RepID=UPI002F94C645